MLWESRLKVFAANTDAVAVKQSHVGKARDPQAWKRGHRHSAPQQDRRISNKECLLTATMNKLLETVEFKSTNTPLT